MERQRCYFLVIGRKDSDGTYQFVKANTDNVIEWTSTIMMAKKFFSLKSAENYQKENKLNRNGNGLTRLLKVRSISKVIDEGEL